MKKTYEIQISKKQYDEKGNFNLFFKRVAEYDYKDEHHIINIIENPIGFFAELIRYHREAYKYGALKEIDKHYSEYHDYSFNAYETLLGEYEIDFNGTKITINVSK